jgi:hypothetical protein
MFLCELIPKLESNTQSDCTQIELVSRGQYFHIPNKRDEHQRGHLPQQLENAKKHRTLKYTFMATHARTMQL